MMDLPTVSRTSLSDLSSSAYQLFDCAIVLDQVMHQSGEDDDHASAILQHPTPSERQSGN